MSKRWWPTSKQSAGTTPTNVFVLCTGRCGSVTFATASGHLTNYTAGHETRAAKILAARLDYPADHIEADNRLSWHLGALGKRFGDDPSDVLYVHLQRERDAVARSYAKRWDSNFRASMIRAFGNGIVMRAREWPHEKRIDVARHYVDTVTTNIEDFLRGRPSMTVHLETIAADYPRFLDRIGAEGDLDAARAEWNVRHNASKTPSEVPSESE